MSDDSQRTAGRLLLEDVDGARSASEDRRMGVLGAISSNGNYFYGIDSTQADLGMLGG